MLTKAAVDFEKVRVLCESPNLLKERLQPFTNATYEKQCFDFDQSSILMIPFINHRASVHVTSYAAHPILCMREEALYAFHMKLCLLFTTEILGHAMQHRQRMFDEEVLMNFLELLGIIIENEMRRTALTYNEEPVRKIVGRICSALEHVAFPDQNKINMNEFNGHKLAILIEINANLLLLSHELHTLHYLCFSTLVHQYASAFVELPALGAKPFCHLEERELIDKEAYHLLLDPLFTNSLTENNVMDLIIRSSQAISDVTTEEHSNLLSELLER